MICGSSVSIHRHRKCDPVSSADHVPATKSYRLRVPRLCTSRNSSACAHAGGSGAAEGEVTVGARRKVANPRIAWARRDTSILATLESAAAARARHQAWHMWYLRGTMHNLRQNPHRAQYDGDRSTG
jgi:hypothetical protein